MIINSEVESENDVPALDFESDEQRLVYNAAVEALEKSSEYKVINVKKVLGSISEQLKEEDFSESKIYLILKDLPSIDGSLIRSRQGRSGGYYLAKNDGSMLVPQIETPIEVESKTLEKHLWPAVAKWLYDHKSVKRASSGIANLKRGKTWSNPDVVGLNIIEELGMFDVEVFTAEVKPSKEQWRLYFFEAVSHKRFSERVYFVYRDDGNISRDDRDELFRYAEKYNVGVVEMQMEDKDYKKMITWDTLSVPEQAEILEKFVELVPAPFEPVPTRDKISFLKRIGISTKADLYSFGSSYEPTA